jgi:hypothetical protein|tara:strand:+ start:159 stop:290 length:132 start_codon:yes stop_codon:yes gene_type:complete
MSKGIVRIQKGLLAIESIVNNKNLSPEVKVEDIKILIDRIWTE